MPMCPESRIECRLSVADLHDTISHELNLHPSKNDASDVERVTSNLSSGQLLSEYPVSEILTSHPYFDSERRRVHVVETWHNTESRDTSMEDLQLEQTTLSDKPTNHSMSSEEQNSMSTDAGDDKAFIVSLKIPTDAFYKPRMGRRHFSDLKVEIYLNGELVNAALLSSLNRDRLTSKTSGKLLFTGLRIHRQVEKPWVYRQSNDRNESLNGSSRWEQIQNALHARVHEKGEKQGQQPVSASFLQMVASMALPTALTGCAGHLAVLDVVIVSGNGMKCGTGTAYLKGPSMLQDPDFIPQTPSRKETQSIVPETPSHLMTPLSSPQQTSPLLGLPTSLLGSFLFSDSTIDVREAMSASFTLGTPTDTDWSPGSTHPLPPPQTHGGDADGSCSGYYHTTDTQDFADSQLAHIGAWVPPDALIDSVLVSGVALQDDVLASQALSCPDITSWQPTECTSAFYNRKNNTNPNTPTKSRTIAPAMKRHNTASPHFLGPTSKAWILPPLDNTEGLPIEPKEVHNAFKTTSNMSVQSPVTCRRRRRRHRPTTAPSTPGEFRYRLQRERTIRDTVRSFIVPDLARDSVVTYAEPGIQRQVDKTRGGEFKEDFFVCGMRFLVR